MQNQKECLIIDDDQDDQEIFLICVNKIDKTIKCASMSDCVEAINKLMSGDFIPGYIFIDVNMPKMNGIDCLKIIKNMDQLKQARVFMYSTTSEGSLVAQSKLLGAEDFIVKPAVTAELVARLSAIFGIVSEKQK